MHHLRGHLLDRIGVMALNGFSIPAGDTIGFVRGFERDRTLGVGGACAGDYPTA
jgi:hypothetical protein